jgi:hypothetical protein
MPPLGAAVNLLEDAAQDGIARRSVVREPHA